jgi:FlaA1/EpsC-like NDP-sugar epimerase
VAAGQLPLVMAVQLTALYASGGLSFIWKHVGMEEVPAFVRAALGSAGVLLFLRFALPAPELFPLRVPIRVILINTVLAFGALLALRVARRAAWERQLVRRRAATPGARRRRVLLVGAGGAGIIALREIRGRGEHEIDVRGFVDDDTLKKGASVSGVRVLGTVADLPKLVPALGVERVIVTISAPTEEEMGRIASICESIPVKVLRLPMLYGLLEGSAPGAPVA